MSKFSIGQKVLVPATVEKITEDETGVYLDVKIVSNNTTKSFSLEASDVALTTPETQEKTPVEGE